MIRKLLDFLFSREKEKASAALHKGTGNPIKGDRYDDFSDHRETVTPAPIEVSPQPMLVAAIQKLPRKKWQAGKVLYHGCSERAKGVDIENKRLTGEYKWVSEDPVYASDYGFYDPRKGKPYLFVCELVRDITCVEASQKALHSFADWSVGAAPGQFSVDFGHHSMLAFGNTEPAVLIDHRQPSGIYKEVLISSPTNLIRVIEVIQLPLDKEDARALIAARFS